MTTTVSDSNHQLPVINIITRTSNRPIYFGECQQSIQIQTYPTELIKRFVTFDDENDLNLYIQSHNGLIAMEVDRETRKSSNHFPYHAYLNTVIKHIHEFCSGWIMILDDDNLLSNAHSLDIIGKKILEDGNDPNNFYIWKCHHGDRIVPSEHTFGKVPKVGDLHISCFAFNYKQAGLVNFETKRGSEAEVIAKLYSQLNCVWIDNVLTQTPGSNNATLADKKPTLMAPNPIEIKTVGPSQNDDEDEEEEEVVGNNLKNLTQTSLVNEKLTTIAEKKQIAEGDEDEEDEVEEPEEDEPEEEEVLNGEEEEVIKKEPVNHDSDEEEIINQEAELPMPISVTLPTPIASPQLTETRKSVSHVRHLSKSDSNWPVTPVNPVVIESIPVASSETNQLLIKLINLLERKDNRRIYILDEDNMRKLSNCLMDALTCTDLEDKLYGILENNTLGQRKVQLNDKILKQTELVEDVEYVKPVTKSNVPRPLVDESSIKKETFVTLPSTNSASKSTNLKIYLITNDQSNKNVPLERNKKILSKHNYDYQIIMAKDLSLYNYQIALKEAIKDAKNQGYEKIALLNGNALLNNKFNDIYQKQVDLINKSKISCNLWFLGNVKEISFKEILGSKFEISDYLLLYDDIVDAKFTTEEKAKTHWKTYGHREARYGAIDVSNGSSQPINGNHGVIISNDIYDQLLDLLNKQNVRDTRNVLLELQNNSDNKTIWNCKPDLIIPPFANSNNHSKNAQASIKNGWYYNHYK